MNKMKLTVIICLLLFGLQIVLPMQSSVQAKQNNKHLVTNAILTNLGTDKGAFLSTWNTSIVDPGSSNADQIVLPLQGTFTVKWGDGSQSSIANSNSVASHTYANPGMYNLNITGNMFGWTFYGLSIQNDAQKLLKISQWGNFQLGTSGGFDFYNASNLQVTATDAPNLTSATNFMRIFMFDANLGNLGNMNGWNTSGITDMNGMFYGASTFNQPLNNWNTSSVTDMSMMFSGDTVFNQPLNNWNTSSVTDMEQMFYGATAFNQPIGSWKTGSVTSMSCMFCSAIAFDQPLNNWDVSHVTNMEQMFQGASTFNQPLGSWNTAKVTTMKLMFYKTSIDQNLGSWDVSNVQKARFMLDYTNLSISNYDALLIGWSKLQLQSNVMFSVGNTHYSSIAISARLHIIDAFGWGITDSGLAIGPSAPTSLTIKPGVGNLTLSWEAPAQDGTFSITKYEIFRSDNNNSGFKLIGTTDSSHLSFVDTGLNSSVTYYYMVEAVNNYISGTNSTSISGTPLKPSSPSKTSPASLVGIFFGFVILTGVRVTKYRRKLN